MSAIISGINWLDIIFLTILLGMVYKGSRAGVGSQLLSLAWWFVLIFFSIGYYSFLASTLFGFITQNWARPISFFVIVALLILTIKFLEMIFNVTTKETLAPIERIGGALIASLRTFLLFGIIGIQLLLLPAAGLHNSVSKGSKTGMFFVELDAGIYSWMTRHLGFVEERARKEVIEKILEGET